MKVYFAMGERQVTSGSLSHCINWGKELSKVLPHNSIIKIFKAKPNENSAKIVCEIVGQSFVHVNNGRTLPVKLLMRIERDGKK